MSTIMSKIQMVAVGCLSATAMAGAFNVPSASAADYGYNQGSVYAQRMERDRGDRDRGDMDRGDRGRGESRYCRSLIRRIEWARRQGDYRLARRLEREYRRECRFNRR